MKVTKYAHACMILEENGQRLMIDPGVITELPQDLSSIVAVIVTHVHGDHFTAGNISKIVAANPDAVVFAGPETFAELNDISCKKEEITADCEKEVGSFKLRLSYGDHAVIYQQVPCKNIRITVNNRLYYPGDSLETPSSPVEAVAVPLNAPWSKASEVVEFIKACNAKTFFPVHDDIITDMGKQFYNNWAKAGIEGTDKAYVILDVGQGLEI